jgi:hypothetical protein
LSSAKPDLVGLPDQARVHPNPFSSKLRPSPLRPTLTDAALEAMPFARAGIAPGTRHKAEPDWPAVHREPRRRGVTLMLL